MRPERLLRCPACGKIITEDEWEEDIQSGGGYCYCGYSAIDENGEIWYPRVLHEYDVYVLQSSASKVNEIGR